LIGNHDLPLYRISHPPLFYHKEDNSKIQAAYDASEDVDLALEILDFDKCI